MKSIPDVTPHLEDLWRYSRVLTRDDADADDLVQDALTRALTLIGTYDPSRPLLPWLIAAVRNTFITGVTRHVSERRRMEKYAALSDTQLLPTQEHSAELSDVTKAIGTLPTEQAEVLHLIGVLGLTYAEAAEILGVPGGTVMSRLSRARAALRDRLDRRRDETFSHLRLVGGRDGHK